MCKLGSRRKIVIILDSMNCYKIIFRFHQTLSNHVISVRSLHILKIAGENSKQCHRNLSKMTSSENYAKLFAGKKIAEAYARFRPEYSDEVYGAILNYCKGGKCDYELAVDVGCGSGQSTLPLASTFKQVVGIDVSKQQINQAQANHRESNISFRIGPSEDLSAFSDDSVDLITCAQALHWMDLEKFYAEVARVLKPGSAIVAYGYGIWVLDVPQAEESVLKFYNETLGGYWGAGRRHVEQKYSKISLPFPGWIRNDDLWIEKQFCVSDFIGYISSWSAYHKYCEDHPGEKELSALSERLEALYSEKTSPPGPGIITARWPVFMLMGRKPQLV